MESIKINSKYSPLWADTESRYFILTGGRGSGKSFAESLFNCHLTYEKGHRILFTRYTMSSAHLSIIPELVEKTEMLGRPEDFKTLKTEVINEATGSDILFRGIKTSQGNQTANLKSLQGVTTWVLDEAEELVDEEIFDTIDLSIRVRDKQNRIIVILNPATKEHFLYKKFFEDMGVEAGFNGVKGDVRYIHTDFRDNIDNLSEGFLASLEKMRIKNPKKYEHKVLGGWLDRAEGVIFENWTIGEFDTHLSPIWGQDYGYSTDPTTLVKVAIDKKHERIYLDEQCYKSNMVTESIYRTNRVCCGSNGLIIADSAEPRLIAELKRKGLNVKGAKKIAINEGIRMMQDFELVITERSKNLYKELNNYQWNDRKSETPIDDHNHLIDAVRYAVVHQLGNPNEGNYFVY